MKRLPGDKWLFILKNLSVYFERTYSVSCHPGTCSIQQSYFPWSSAILVPLGALLVVFDIPHQIQFQLGFGFPNFLCMFEQFPCISPRLLVLASTFHIITLLLLIVKYYETVKSLKTIENVLQKKGESLYCSVDTHPKALKVC